MELHVDYGSSASDGDAEDLKSETLEQAHEDDVPVVRGGVSLHPLKKKLNLNVAPVVSSRVRRL